MSKRSTRLYSAIGCAAVLVIAAGCGGLPVRVTQFSQGKILVLPVQDVVQGGEAHEKGEGSGEATTEHLLTALEARGWDVDTVVGGSFSHTQMASSADAINAGKSKGCPLVLQVALGEFRNAAPMTFRSDFVTLESASMYDSASGEVVWALLKPRIWEKSNLGNHLGLLNTIAVAIADSIDDAIKQ